MKKKKRKVAMRFLLFMAMLVMLFSGYRILSIGQMNTEGEKTYENIADAVRISKKNANQEATLSRESSIKPQIEIPINPIDFAVLKDINKDGVAWLYCPNTLIDYPVMEAIDYDYYLHHLANGTYNENGTLFLDYNSPADFSGKLNIIYGHNMQSGLMFASLIGYKEQAYFESHPYMYLYTEKGNYCAELLYGCVIDVDVWQEQAFMLEKNLNALLIYAKENTTFTSSTNGISEDKFLVMSTCSYEFDEARYIVIGRLVPEYREEK